MSRIGFHGSSVNQCFQKYAQIEYVNKKNNNYKIINFKLIDFLPCNHYS